jgi:integrase
MFMPKRKAFHLTKRIIESADTDTIIWDLLAPGLGVRTTVKGHRSFIFQYRSLSGGQGRIALGHFPSMTVEEARKAARQLRTSVDLGGNPSKDRQAVRSAPTVAYYIDYYTGEYAEARLEEQTAKEMRQLLNRFVRPTLGTQKMSDIQDADIVRIHGRVKAEVSVYRANKVLAGLSKMFSLAIKGRACTFNPCKGVEKYTEDERHTYLNQQQVVRLLDACDRYEDQQAANVIRLLLMTGARFREVLHATWSQFDLEDRSWTKPSSHTKTKRVHKVRLGRATVQLLRNMERERTSEYLFPGRSLGSPRTDLKRPWRAIQKAADLCGYRIHDLRRTYASFMLSSGQTLDVVGKMLGHTQASTTKRYASLFSEVELEAADATYDAMMPSYRVVGGSKS